jgi:hypothetical protein
MKAKQHKHTVRQCGVTFSCFLFACLLCAAVSAQSGRRQAPPPAAPPVPTPTPEPPKVEHTPPPPQSVLVAGFAPLSVNLSTTDSDIVMGTFVQRLRAADALKIETANNLSRDGARKRAKTETERIVVWLQLQANGMDSIGVQRPYPEDLHIQFAIFEPGTGAIRTSGNVYLRTIRNTLPGGRTGCYPNRYGLDGSLMVGALETAERVFAALSIPDPPLCR